MDAEIIYRLRHTYHKEGCPYLIYEDHWLKTTDNMSWREMAEALGLEVDWSVPNAIEVEVFAPPNAIPSIKKKEV